MRHFQQGLSFEEIDELYARGVPPRKFSKTVLEPAVLRGKGEDA
jgi:hypothetical protein